MSKPEFKVGQTIWRGFRYWVNLGDVSSYRYAGWNTSFIAYRITKITARQIYCEHLADTIHGELKTAKDYKPIVLMRTSMETFGKQYHTRYHEYFYAVKPDRDPEHQDAPTSEVVNLLNLPMPYSEDDVKRAYRRLARTAHPDGGGSNAAFIELKRARDAALKTAVQ